MVQFTLETCHIHCFVTKNVSTTYSGLQVIHTVIFIPILNFSRHYLYLVPIKISVKMHLIHL